RAPGPRDSADEPRRLPGGRRQAVVASRRLDGPLRGGRRSAPRRLLRQRGARHPLLRLRGGRGPADARERSGELSAEVSPQLQDSDGRDARRQLRDRTAGQAGHVPTLSLLESAPKGNDSTPTIVASGARSDRSAWYA